jgi:hypothetical protein
MIYVPKALLFASLAMAVSVVDANSTVPTHCKSGEVSIVNAWMGKAIPTSAGWVNSRTGKFVSLCADRTTEPFGKVVYRYGSSEKIDLAVLATREKPFGIFSRGTTPHTGDDLVYFTRGGYTYYIAIATGMGSGVFLNIYKGDKLISSHFSGNAEGSDYTIGPAEIHFYDQAKSKLFSYKEPPNSF